MLAACADREPPRRADGDTAPADAPAVARIVCDKAGTAVLTPVVKPQPDGIHLSVQNELGFDAGFSAMMSSGRGAGGNANEGTSTHVLALPPGTLKVGCFPKDLTAEPDEAPLEVVDVDGLYRSTDIGCEVVGSGIGEYAPGSPGINGDLLEAARERFDEAHGLEDDDVVERAGYPESELPIYRLVRDGEVLATVEYEPWENEGQYVEGTFSACDTL